MANPDFMHRAIAISREKMEANMGGPFGAVIVRDGKIIAEGFNKVTSTNDPTAHAEVVAIREACQKIGDFSLKGAEIYTSCEPCPLCLAAIFWARIETIYYANTRADAAEIGFDDAVLYEEIARPLDKRILPIHRLDHAEARKVFDDWMNKEDRIEY
ncbi:MAG: nucleoside deaminase [Rhizobiales bacterium]|nr:nucleoside deaminase [Hyphomicrobiales bacterium]